MAPNAGPGANSALVDAAVLTEELARTATVVAALTAYTARRRRPVRRVQDAADRLAQLAHWRGRTTTRLRDALLGFVDRRAGLAERLVRTTMQEDPAALRETVRSLATRSA
jgi:2-polyprenyl-6-methoxyphenol hydroxylase-like FAD-dependent oxidoreductase